MKEVKDQMHPLILSSVFHYEFVFIHPFTDGNDRMARLWHTAILAKWNPIFESGTPHSHYFSDELGVPIFFANLCDKMYILCIDSILALLFVSGNIHMESEQKDALKITFLKVGKVDAIIAQTQEKTMVIDAGEEDDGEEVVSFLTNQGVFKVDVLIITHYDQDHVGGADTLVESLDVAQVFLPDYEGNHIEYLDFMTSLDEKNIKPQLLTEPIEFQFGD